MILIIFLVLLSIIAFTLFLFLLSYIFYPSQQHSKQQEDSEQKEDSKQKEDPKEKGNSKQKEDPKEKGNRQDFFPTIHSTCSMSSDCGGNLVCDNVCKTCKNTSGNKCSSDVDCISGHFCNNWVCTPVPPSSPHFKEPIIQSNSSRKRVKWNDSANQIFYI